MSEELRPLGAYTADELVQELRKRVTVGVFVVMAGCPSAAEEFRARKAAVDGTPIMEFLYTSTGEFRDTLEALHRCIAFSVRHRVALFRKSFGVSPACYGESN